MKQTLLPLLMLLAGAVGGSLLSGRSTAARDDAAVNAETVVVLRAERNHTLQVDRITDSATNDDTNPAEWVLILQTPGRKPVALVCRER